MYIMTVDKSLLRLECTVYFILTSLSNFHIKGLYNGIEQLIYFYIIFELIRIHKYSNKMEICFVLISWNLSQIYKNMVDANIHGQKHLL